MYKRCLYALVVLALIPAMLVALPAGAAKTQITIMTDWERNSPTFQKLVDMYEAEHPNVDITWQTENITAGVGIEKYIAAIAAGSPPDLIALSTWADLAKQGVFEPLDRYYEKSSLKGKYHPVLLQGKSMDGRLYGIPAFDGGPGRGLMYNKELLSESGLAAPSPNVAMTWDELAHISKKVAQTTTDGRVLRLGYYPAETNGHSIGQMAPSYNVDWYDEKAQRAMLDRPELVEAMEMLKRNFYEPWGFNNIDALVKPANMWPNHPKSLFGNKQTAAFVAGYWAWNSGDIAVSGKFAADATWAPNSEGKRVQSLNAWGLFMSSGSKNKQAAWDFLEFVASPRATAVLYQDLGWLGGMNSDLPRYIDLRNKPALQWYIQSVEQADTMVAPPPTPWDRQAQTSWYDVYTKVMSGKGSAQQFLAEANRVLNNQIQQDLAKAK